MPGKRSDQTSNTAWAARRPFSNLGFQSFQKIATICAGIQFTLEFSERVIWGIPNQSIGLGSPAGGWRPGGPQCEKCSGPLSGGWQ